MIAARDRTEVLCSHGEQLWPPCSIGRSASVKTKWISNNHVPWTVSDFLHQEEPQLVKHTYTWPSLWCLLDSIQDCPATDRISNLLETDSTNHLSPADKLPGFLRDKVRASRGLASQLHFSSISASNHLTGTNHECTRRWRGAIHP